MTAFTKYQEAKAMYEAVPEETREDLALSLEWAKKTLTEKEGAGHIFQIIPDMGDALCSCEFSKPEWAGSHVGSCMPYGSEAIVMAVCEYMVGL